MNHDQLHFLKIELSAKKGADERLSIWLLSDRLLTKSRLYWPLLHYCPLFRAIL